jgi:transcriptional regulator with XRE-family HTH domain
MATKSQHALAYKKLPGLLLELRKQSRLTQRELGQRLGKPHSWIYNCEVGNRRVDVTEFILWARACGVKSSEAFAKIDKMI